MNTNDIIVSSLPRSGSTAAWQIVQIANKKRISKYHNYVSGNSRVVYTIRHPRDVFLSLKRIKEIKDCYDTKGIDSILSEMESCCDDYEKFILDSQGHHIGGKGRHVLVLRYEDWYGDIKKLIRKISVFMSLDWTDDQVSEISAHCNIEANKKRADKFKSFNEADHFSHIHGIHIGPNNGKVNGWRSFNFDMLDYYTKNRIYELCKRFGYNDD